MKLDVPMIFQPENSVDCGIAGVTMLLNYHGINISFDDVKRQIIIDDIGTYAPQIGSFIIHKGLHVKIITHHPALFTINDRGMGQEDIMRRFEQLKENSKKSQDIKVLNHFIQFMKDGGEIIIKIPDARDITTQIMSKRPVGALLTTFFLHHTEPKFNFHFNLVTGIDDKHVFVNDPIARLGGQKIYAINDFFFGLYASTYGDLDNGCLILVE